MAELKNKGGISCVGLRGASDLEPHQLCLILGDKKMI